MNDNTGREKVSGLTGKCCFSARVICLWMDMYVKRSKDFRVEQSVDYVGCATGIRQGKVWHIVACFFFHMLKRFEQLKEQFEQQQQNSSKQQSAVVPGNQGMD